MSNIPKILLGGFIATTIIAACLPDLTPEQKARHLVHQDILNEHNAKVKAYQAETRRLAEEKKSLKAYVVMFCLDKAKSYILSNSSVSLVLGYIEVKTQKIIVNGSASAKNGFGGDSYTGWKCTVDLDKDGNITKYLIE
jgi:hypothetical protein